LCKFKLFDSDLLRFDKSSKDSLVVANGLIAVLISVSGNIYCFDLKFSFIDSIDESMSIHLAADDQRKLFVPSKDNTREILGVMIFVQHMHLEWIQFKD
jgi:hypothetical protein